MPDLASLQFDIDSSQAQRAIAVLETLKASSISVTQATSQQNQNTAALSQAYDQQRDKLNQLTQQTKTYDGTISGLITRLDELRRVMNTSQSALNSYAATLTQATSLATTLNASVEGLDRYIARARQLNTTTQDLATGFERITAALKNQTAAGNETRQMLTQMGVNTGNLGPNQADVVLQRFVDQLRTYRFTGQTVAAAQSILGPGFDAQALLALQAQPYQSMFQREQMERQTAARGQIDSQQAQLQRITNDLDRHAARLADLSGRYTLDPTVLGRLGLPSNPFIPADARRQEFERINALPPDQRRQYETYGFQIQQAVLNSGPANALRNFTSGTWSSNQDEIGVRLRMETAANGFVSAIANAWGRELQNAVGLYKPALTEDTRNLLPSEQRYLRNQSAGILANYGDTSLLAWTQAENRETDFNADTTLPDRYRVAFGDDGARRLANQRASLAQATRYAQRPEQQVLDDARREALIMALPESQRAQARYGLQYLGQMAGAAAVTALPADTTLAGITGSAALNASQQQAGQIGFAQSVTSQMQQGHEEAQRQIEFQKQLTGAVHDSRAAAEDFTRVWNARTDAMRLGATEEQKQRAEEDVRQTAEHQRITQGTSALAQMEKENRDRRESLELLKQLNAEGATDEERQRRQADLAEQQRIRSSVESGTLPSGNSIDAINTREQTRQAMRAQTPAATAVAEREAALRNQIDDSQTLLELMHQHNESQAQATRDLESQKALTAAIVEARRAGRTADADALEAARATTHEMERQAAIAAQRVNNVNATRQIQLENEYDRYVGSLPIDQQAAARASRAAWVANRQAEQAPTTGTPATTPLWIQRPEAQPYMGMLRQATAANPAIPSVGLLAELIGQESSYRNLPNAMGPGGTPISTAGGLGQQLAGNPALHGGDRFDPATSIAAAAEEFAQRLRQSGGNIAAAATGYGVAGSNLSPARRQSVLAALQRAAAIEPMIGPPMPGGLAPDSSEAAQTAATRESARIQQETGIQNEQRQFAVRSALEAQRTTLLRQGQTGEAARLVAPDLNLNPDLRADQMTRQRLSIIQGQAQQAAGAAGSTDQSISNLGRLAEAYRTNQSAVDALTLKLQAEAEARAAGTGIIDTENRTRQLLSEQLSRQQTEAGQRTLGLRDEDEVQRALNAAGPFASQATLANTRENVQLRQYFRDRPGLEDTPQGQDLKAQTQASQTTRQQTQDMDDLRNAARQTQSALESTFEAVVIHGERGRNVVTGLAQSLETIALRTVVEKPFERLLDQALGGFGGDGSGGGDGTGRGGFGLLGRLLGGGGGAAPGGGGGGGANPLGALARGGGLIGAGVDALGGQGFYRGGGLIGNWFGNSSPPSTNTIGSDLGGGSADLGYTPATDLNDTFALGDIFVQPPPARRHRGYGSIVDYENQIVEAPTMFRFARGGAIGTMGEAGPEAVMPLKRGADGKLGIAAGGGGGSSGPVINFHVSTPNADSFVATRAQMGARIAAQLAHVQMRNSTG